MTALQATYWPASADGLVLAQANGSSQPASASGLPQATTAPALDTSAGPLPSETDALLPQPGQHSSAFHVTVARDPPWPSASKTGSAGSGQAHEGEEDPENTRRVIASSIIGNTLEVGRRSACHACALAGRSRQPEAEHLPSLCTHPRSILSVYAKPPVRPGPSLPAVV